VLVSKRLLPPWTIQCRRPHLRRSLQCDKEVELPKRIGISTRFFGHDFLMAFSCKGRGICPSCKRSAQGGDGGGVRWSWLIAAPGSSLRKTPPPGPRRWSWGQQPDHQGHAGHRPRHEHKDSQDTPFQEHADDEAREDHSGDPAGAVV
jgi:hypothetical protein